jgi:hypothetical protein
MTDMAPAICATRIEAVFDTVVDNDRLLRFSFDMFGFEKRFSFHARRSPTGSE